MVLLHQHLLFHLPGTYTLAESNRCGDATDTMVVNYLDAPDPFTLGPDTTLCPGESITLSAPSTAFEINWQDGSNQPTIIADQALTYSLQLSNDCGVVSDNIVLDYDTRVPLLNLDPSISWCEGDIISLNATQPFAAGYLWSNGSSSPTLQVTTPGLYSIEVTTPCSTVSQEVDVFPGTDCVVPEVNDGFYLPNVFSPNGDGINDVFSVSVGSDLDVTSMVGTIYDRWGNRVHGSTENPFNWDGFFNDELVLPGAYVFVIQIEYLLGGTSRQETLYGDVTVVR
ncbi:MAG: gliding motility-associated C-terminal domain-containing protein [Saprospiraceae bacterium]|nr:gliding motility-associated C-terminal domain-containing protein [Candidatus Opimibacter skivensis]